MKTLKECIEATKCRKGKATGTTKDGAFWFACDEIHLRDAGGDGIGNSGALIDYDLQLRHYRDGTVKAMVCWSSWHQNSGHGNRHCAANILDCTTAEQVIVELKRGLVFDYQFSDKETVYSDGKVETVTAALVALGLAECEPSPDEERA